MSRLWIAAGVALALCIPLAVGGYQTVKDFSRPKNPPDPIALREPPPKDLPARACRSEAPSTSALHYTHVIWIFMENHGYNEVVDQANQPFTRWLTDHCGLALNYHNVTHNSLPNYLAAVSGLLPRSWNAVNRASIERDCPFNACRVRGPTLFGQIRSKGLEWRSFEEAMDFPCQGHAGGTRYKLYWPKHNPAFYFPEIRSDCRRWDLPMGSYAAGNLHDELRAGTLPAFAFLTPDMCHDTHDCWSQTGDEWLATWVNEIVAGKNYRNNDTVLFITWDEGEGGATGANCVTSSADDCHVALIAVSPSTGPDMRPRQSFSHYSLLRTTEEILGLDLLGEAAHAASMRSAFGLGG